MSDAPVSFPSGKHGDLEAALQRLDDCVRMMTHRTGLSESRDIQALATVKAALEAAEADARQYREALENVVDAARWGRLLWGGRDGWG